MLMHTAEANIKKQIVEVSRLMYNRGLVTAYEGNLSVRFGDKVYITPSAICKGFLTEEMIMVTDMDGKVLEGTCKVSSEYKIHLGAYKSRPDIESVIHTHSPYATAYAVANKAIETKAYPEMIVLFDRIPLAPYGTPSTDEVYKGVEKYIMEYDIILLANHGVMAVGKDAYESFFRIESAEGIAKTLTLAGQLGGSKDLSYDKLRELYEIRCRSRSINKRYCL